MPRRKKDKSLRLRDHILDVDQWVRENETPVLPKPPRDEKRRSVWKVWTLLWRVKKHGEWTNRQYCKTRGVYDKCSYHWFEFEDFYRDVGPKQEGKMLCRKDPSKPYGPDNFQWLTRAEARSYGRNLNKAIDICERLLNGERTVDICKAVDVERRTVYRIRTGGTHPGLLERMRFLREEFEGDDIP